MERVEEGAEAGDVIPNHYEERVLGGPGGDDKGMARVERVQEIQYNEDDLYITF